MNLNYFAIPGLKFKINNATIDQVALLVCITMNVNVIRLVSKSRARVHVDARGLCYLVLRTNNPTLSLKDIGKFFNRDHTTVIHALRTIKNDISVNDYLHEKLIEIESRLKT